MGDGDYMYAFQQVVMPIASEFNPDLVISKCAANNTWQCSADRAQLPLALTPLSAMSLVDASSLLLAMPT